METLETIYNDKSVMSYVRSKIDEVSSKITNVWKLEESIFKQLECYYCKCDKRSIKRIKYLIDREIVQALKRYTTEKVVMFSELTIVDDFGESIDYEPTDVLANVSETVLKDFSLNEKISGLASTDCERFVLQAWINGFTDKAIAAELALLDGSNPNSKRIWVQRFKTRCRKKLLAA